MVRQTSIDVYHRIKAEGLLSKMRWEVYDVLFREGPLTGKELDRKLGTDSAHKRLSELKQLGVIADSGEKVRPCTVSGELVVEWDVTAALPEKATTPPKQSSPRPSSGELSKAVEDLRELWRVAQAAGYRPSEALGRVGAWLANGAPVE